MRVEVEGGAAVLFEPITAAGSVNLALAGKFEQHGVLFFGSALGGVVQLIQKRLHVGSGFHHLVGGGEVGPVGEAEELGDLLADGEQVEENLFVLRVGAGVVGEEHALAQGMGPGEGHDGEVVGKIGGESDFAVFCWFVSFEEVGRQAVEI